MNNAKIFLRLIKTITLCVVLISDSSLGKAQAEKTVQISLPDSSAYPTISVFIDPFDRNGNLIESLQADQITLVEDGYETDLLDMGALNPGIQLVIAFNFSTPFAIQDISGRSRFEYIKESLLNWSAQPLETGADDLSVIDNLGLESIHIKEKADWIKALEQLEPPTKESVSDFNVLARAIEVASDPVDHNGMKKSVILFTHQPTPDVFETIDSLISQAKDNQVKVFTIMVSSPAYFETAGATQLQTLSAETGGKYLTFTGEEPLADLGQLLHPLRTTYMLKYHSSIVSSGTHTLEITIASSPADVEGIREFTLDIQPPNPIFLTPPRSVTRRPIEEVVEDTQTIRYEPTSLTLPILVEFPDLHPRELEELIFRVDGEVIDVKTSPPYDQFIWELDDYQVSGTHYLTLEAVDTMGLSRISVQTPIEVEVVTPTQDVWDVARKNSTTLLGLGLILLLGLALFGLVSRGRIRPGNNRLFSFVRIQANQAARSLQRVISQRKQSPAAHSTRDFNPYRLVPVNPISQQLFPDQIQINQAEITLGNSNLKEGIRIQHPSIIPEHARIHVLEGDQYQITDLGSTAGTWINYQQIPPSSPHIVKDGDIINIGEAAFRFQFKKRPISPKESEEN